MRLRSASFCVWPTRWWGCGTTRTTSMACRRSTVRRRTVPGGCCGVAAMSDETAMGDDSPGNMIAPQGAPDGEANGAQGNGSAQADRGMPDLGQHRGGRPRAWWLTPLMVIV